ncbi:hypothetical protein IMG5_034980 [Ichthyophthirius multifiliis]|uniref:Uncharacterized protein n=1 Tax=Ichthyophthirius multifiliis TaxID=5932 RepID=G0QLR1_ICHMU|nr:hypothetical protein IMG5_034980 [Ichthyophthirius multifiliis]EGR33842.1 hypothetical protein IMG5_034980 [Ichthyophthirius multifiliis]|eukprot:XP_004039066.1 hypothetical protein IMG5_034980 [Ichthyophthirius multifiliis]
MGGCSSCKSFLDLQSAQDACCQEKTCKAVVYTQQDGKWVYQIRLDDKFEFTDSYIQGETIYFLKRREFYSEKIIVVEENKELKNKSAFITYTGKQYLGIVGWYNSKATKCDYDEISNMRLEVCDNQCHSFGTLEDAMKECCSIPECYGVTQISESNFQTRFSKKLYKEVGYQSFFRSSTQGLKEKKTTTTKQIQAWDEEFDWQNAYRKPTYEEQIKIDKKNQQYKWNGAEEKITKKKTSTMNYTGKTIKGVKGWWSGKQQDCNYGEVLDASLGKDCSGECQVFSKFEDALASCCSQPKCVGVTYSNSGTTSWGFQTRFVYSVRASKTGEYSYYRGWTTYPLEITSYQASTKTETLERSVVPSGVQKKITVTVENVTYTCTYLQFLEAQQEQKLDQKQTFENLEYALDSCCGQNECLGVQLSNGILSLQGGKNIGFGQKNDIVYFLANRDEEIVNKIITRVSMAQEKHLQKQN